MALVRDTACYKQPAREEKGDKALATEGILATKISSKMERFTLKGE